jgi:hypothetical protein
LGFAHGRHPDDAQPLGAGLDGRLIARVDFHWKEHQTVGEFDGKTKYGRLLKPGQRIEDVIFKETAGGRDT